jgi:hypothetical protein
MTGMYLSSSCSPFCTLMDWAAMFSPSQLTWSYGLYRQSVGLIARATALSENRYECPFSGTKSQKSRHGTELYEETKYLRRILRDVLIPFTFRFKTVLIWRKYFI